MPPTRIEATRMIPGRGDPIDDGVVIIDGDAIAYAGPKGEAPAASGTDVVTADTVMPGMWECHAHFWGLHDANLERLAAVAPHVGVLRAARSVGTALQAGFTSVREVGGYGAFLAVSVDEGTIPGPTIYASGSVLSQTGGHADIHGFPIDQVDDVFERHFGSTTLCDGVDDCRRMVRRQLRLGARVIKICASGGVMSQLDHPMHQQFSDEELKVIVEEAARADRVVAAHCHGKAGIMAALRAGVRTIEHGTYLDDEAATAMVETGATLVATRFIVEHLRAGGRRIGMPDYAFAKIEALADQHRQAVATAVSAGVTMATGTDMITLDTWGRNGEELAHLVDAGMTVLQAIEAATANGPGTVGPQAGSTGRLEVGFDADVITLDGNPLTDIGLLADPARVTGVWKRGRRCKG